MKLCSATLLVCFLLSSLVGNASASNLRDDEKLATAHQDDQLVSTRMQRFKARMKAMLDDSDLLKHRVLTDEDPSVIDAPPVIDPSVAALQVQVSTLQGHVDSLMAKLQCVDSTSDDENLYFHKCNVHIRNGQSATATMNGLGNLIIGYNEDDSNLGGSEFDRRHGSHNIVVGEEHAFTSYGGVIFGVQNEISAPYSSVLGGRNNRARRTATVVVGGRSNSAAAREAVVVGGISNSVDNLHSVAIGDTSLDKSIKGLGENVTALQTSVGGLHGELDDIDGLASEFGETLSQIEENVTELQYFVDSILQGGPPPDDLNELISDPTFGFLEIVRGFVESFDNLTEQLDYRFAGIESDIDFLKSFFSFNGTDPSDDDSDPSDSYYQVETIFEFLLEIFQEDPCSDDDAFSPQSYACAWFKSERIPTFASPTQVAERFVLATLYYSTNGTDWAPSTWLKEDQCDWDGVECDSNREVVSLFLGEYCCLSGTIPTVIGFLGQLQHLDMSQSTLEDFLQSELGLLSNLQSLNVEGNALNGTIPVELGLLTNLQTLIVSGNELTGIVPVELGLLTKLQHLNVNENALTGSVPVELGLLTNLQILFLQSNELTGTIPVELGTLWELELLYVADNALTGTIPSELGNIGSLQYLAVQGNALTGTIPVELGALWVLTSLDVSNNDLRGTIPTELGQLSWLFVQGNKLSGTVPDSLCKSSLNIVADCDTSLECCNVTGSDQLETTFALLLDALEEDPCSDDSDEYSDEELCGWLKLDMIPSDASHDQVIERFVLAALYFSTNGAEWLLSTWLDKYHCDWEGVGCSSNGEVVTLSLAGIGLSGTIPTEIALLTNLQNLYVQRNALTGTIPVELGTLWELELLYMADNALTGTIPSELGNLSSLQHLFAQGNKLSGTVPDSLCKSSLLIIVDCETGVECTCKD